MPRPLESGTSLRSRRCPSVVSWFVSLAATVLPGATLAADEPSSPEVMTITASRVPRARAAIPYAATILEGEDLDHTISRSVEDALRFVPGLEVNRQGARGGLTELYLRGLDPNHVVVLVDGVRLNDPTNSRGGSFDPTTLALVDIDRIEIVRGPLSTVYGSDALAGAINVVTRSASPSAEPTSSVRIQGGRFHSGSAVAQASTGIKGVVGLSLGAAIDTSRDPDSDGGYDGSSFKAKLAGTLPGEVDWEAFTRLHRSSARGFPDSSGGSELAVLRSMEDRNVREILFGVTAERVFPNLVTLGARASRVSRRLELDSPGIDVVPPFDPTPVFLMGEGDIPRMRNRDEYSRWDLGLVSDWSLPDLTLAKIPVGSRLVFGGDVVWEDGQSGTFLFDFLAPGPQPFPFAEHRRTIGVYAELEESIGDYVTVSGSLRYDSIREEKDRWSPSVGATLRIPDTPLTLFGNYGEGFKLPSFYALGNPLVGSSSLRTEESHGWEVGVRAASEDGRWRARVSYFDQRVKNLIDFNDVTFRLENLNRLVSRGVEVEGMWVPIDTVRLRLGGSWNHTNFQGSPLEPENRPRWRGFAELSFDPVDSVEVSLRALLVSSMKASSFRTAPAVDTLSGYERFDLRVAWAARDWLDVFFVIENLTDATPREAVGFESPGIAPRAGVTLRM